MEVSGASLLQPNRTHIRSAILMNIQLHWAPCRHKGEWWYCLTASCYACFTPGERGPQQPFKKKLNKHHSRSASFEGEKNL